MEFTKEQIIEICKKLNININTNISSDFFISTVSDTTYKVEYNNRPFDMIKDIITHKAKQELKLEIKSLMLL